MALNVSSIFASLVESAALIVITLLLARRRLLAKTWA